MEDKQKVYIKGVPSRGTEVIKALEDLGGNNLYNYDGEDDAADYYINPNGVIGCAYTKGNAVYPFLMEFYKKIELPRWKPNYRESYYFIDCDGLIIEEVWYNIQIDKSRYEFGNCFVGIDEAKIARDKIKEMLKKQ